MASNEMEIDESNYGNSDQTEVNDCDTNQDSEFLEPPSKIPRLENVNTEASQSSKELQNLHEFEIIDELDNEENLENEDSDEYLDDNELYDLLDQGMDGKLVAGERDRNSEGLEEKEKIVLQEKGHNPFDILPEGWLVVTHNSGMPVYLHKETRVCTMSRPYFLGPGSVRRHDIPVSAIPCLQYRRALGKETEENSVPVDVKTESPQTESLPNEVTLEPQGQHSSEGDNLVKGDNLENGDDIVNVNVIEANEGTSVKKELNGETDSGQTNENQSGELASTNGGKVLPGSKVRIETLSERKQDTSLDSLEVRQYCEKLFEFKSITVKKWRTWKDRRIHMKKQFRPELPSNTKLLITCPVPPTSKSGLIKSNKLKEFVLNPSGKSYICILHEYIQHTMRVQPRYKYKELENSMTPFSATVIIEDIEYGTGYASSKKAAKLEAAKSTLEVLIPDMNKVTQEPVTDIEDLSFFDEVKIEDARVYELGNKAGQPSPYQILDECLKRNYGLGDTKCTMNMKLLKHQKSEFTLTVGKHTASVIAKNKRDGKQRAAQAILQKLHPHVQCWGSLLRLYGKSSVKGLLEKKEELNINQLQNQDKSVKPCLSILENLKKEMMKLHKEKGSIKSKGKLHIETANFPKKVPNLDL